MVILFRDLEMQETEFSVQNNVKNKRETA